MSDNALTKIEPQPVAPSVEGMITLAIEKGATVETLERLMAIRREVRAEQAKEAYDRALAAFQAECPTIAKTEKVMNRDGRSVRYQYAPLDAIVNQVKGLLQKHGFSYTVNAKAELTQVTAICKLTHAYGHSETSEFAVPIDPDGFMNPAQKVASALTFAKRYAFCNAAGIMTGDADDDSQASHDAQTKAPSKATTQPAKPAQKPPAQATEEQKARWIAMLKPLGEHALAYAYEQGWLLGPGQDKDGNDTPGEPLDLISLKDVPVGKKQADAILEAIRHRMDGASVPYTEERFLDEPEPRHETDNPQYDENGDEVESITGILEKVAVKEGQSKKGKWVRYGLKVGSDWYSTFDKVLGAVAEKDKGHAVRVCFRRGDRGNDLVSIERAPKA